MQAPARASATARERAAWRSVRLRGSVLPVPTRRERPVTRLQLTVPRSRDIPHMVAVTRSCIAASRSGSSVSGPNEAPYRQADPHGDPAREQSRRRDDQPGARHLRQPSVAQLAKPVRQGDECRRRCSAPHRLRARRCPPRASGCGKSNSSATNRCRVLGFRSLSACWYPGL